jgi:hypothetical protein
MLTRTAIATAAIVTFSGYAFATDATYYPPQTSYVPPQTSPVYSPAPMVTADVSLAFGGWWYNEDCCDDSGAFLDADGRVNIPLGNGWNLMPEARLSADLTNDYSLISGILHFYKNLPNAAIGPFVAVSGFTGGPTACTIDSYGFGQFGAFLDYYITPECKLTGGLQVASGSGESIVEGSAKFTKHLANTHFNLFAAAYVDSYNGGGSEFSAEIGATANIGPIIQNLLQQDDSRPFRFTPIGGGGGLAAAY